MEKKYHILFLNLPYIEQRELMRLWGNGFVFIQGFMREGEFKKIEICPETKRWIVDGDLIKNVGLYISKSLNYTLKNLTQETVEKLNHEMNNAFYLRSRNLKEPLEYELTIEEYNDIRILFDSFEPTFEKSNVSMNDFTGLFSF